ncbi:MAG: hypothetical protein ABIF12_01100 [bacterium]
MKLKNIIVLFFLSLIFISSSLPLNQILNHNESVISLVKDNFDDLLNYNFLHIEHKEKQLKVSQKLIELIQTNQHQFLEKLVHVYNLVDAKFLVWQAAAFLSDQFSNLSYRQLQQIRIQILSVICFVQDKKLTTKYISNLVKSFMYKKFYSKYKKLLDADFDLPEYSLFINTFLKNSSNFNFILDEKEIDNLIGKLSEQKVLHENLELFLQNLLKIKVNFLYKKDVQSNFNQAFEAKDPSLKMLVIKHYILLTKSDFKEYLDIHETSVCETSELFNRYLDVVSYYLDNVNILNQPMFIFDFFKFYSDLSVLKDKYKGIIPFTSFGGNKKLLNIINQMEEVLNIILQKIHEKIGTGPGWIQKMFLGKTAIPQEVINFALKIFEDKFLSKI